MSNAPHEKPGIDFGTFTMPLNENFEVVEVTYADGRKVRAKQFVDVTDESDVIEVVLRPRAES